MAGVPTKRRFNLAKVDSWLSVGQWAWDRAFALVASTAGATMIGFAAQASDRVNAYGPIGWAAIGLIAFVVLYLLFIHGRRVLTAARLDRASAMIAERTAEHASVNPLAEDYRNQRIRLVDLYTPFGQPLLNRTFRRCDLIGPAVLWISPTTAFTMNRSDNVEFIKINAQTARNWPNKLAIVGGSIHECYLVNVIILVHDAQAETFGQMFPQRIQWMNDPILQGEAPKLLEPPSTERETSQ